MPYCVSGRQIVYSNIQWRDRNCFDSFLEAQTEYRSIWNTPDAPSTFLNINNGLVAVPAEVVASRTPDSVPSPVATVNVARESGDIKDKFVARFTLDMSQINIMISPKLIQETVGAQLKVFLTHAVGQLLQTEDMKAALIPKLKEHLLDMSLNEIMQVSGKSLNELSWLFDRE